MLRVTGPGYSSRSARGDIFATYMLFYAKKCNAANLDQSTYCSFVELNIDSQISSLLLLRPSFRKCSFWGFARVIAYKYPHSPATATTHDGKIYSRLIIVVQDGRAVHLFASINGYINNYRHGTLLREHAPDVARLP